MFDRAQKNYLQQGSDAQPLSVSLWQPHSHDSLEVMPSYTNLCSVHASQILITYLSEPAEHIK